MEDVRCPPHTTICIDTYSFAALGLPIHEVREEFKRLKQFITEYIQQQFHGGE